MPNQLPLFPVAGYIDREVYFFIFNIIVYNRNHMSVYSLNYLRNRTSAYIIN